MIMVLLIAAIVDIGFFLFNSLVTASPYLLEAHYLIAVLGAFLLILTGVAPPVRGISCRTHAVQVHNFHRELLLEEPTTENPFFMSTIWYVQYIFHRD